tara:strand:- start:127 stop:1095 length:969 start_codon:yes stop_codon:yes gene_type:complete
MQKIENISTNNSYLKQDNIISFLKNKKKSLPTKYLYDDLGSKLFEEICDTEEYYLTRTEKEILDKYSKDIILKSGVMEFFELGGGASKKTKVLLQEALKNNIALTYSSLDISDKALKMSFDELKNISKNLKIKLYNGDFINDLNNLSMSNSPRLYLFLGSTLGNFDDELAIKFLSNLSKIMKKNDSFLLGVDKIKDEKVLVSAYNDKSGFTKKFNKNILNVVNKKYNLNFNQVNFNHNAEFNTEKSQIEMYLEAITDQNITLPNDESISINSGEKILTEISRKFTDNTINMLFSKASLNIVDHYNDKKKYFSLYLLKSNQYS